MASFDQRHQQVEQQINVAGGLSITAPTSPEALRRQRNRSSMIEKVRGYWIAGVLEPSLHGTAPIALGLSEQTRAVPDPWEPVFRRPQQSTQPLPTGTGITQAYDHAGGELLILGEPGSGKTMLLLELAQDLLNRAAQDEAHPIPVIFNLSSWAAKRQPLTDWLIDELYTKYQVPRKLGQSWIATDQILPLLDGLDEVIAEHRAACIDAINAYRQEHGLMPTVVCSRSADYPAQSVRLRSAIIIQPLTLQQIDAYLESIGQSGEALRVMLHHNPQLQELATSPLVLSVLIQTYSGKSLEALSDTELPTTQKQIFADYVELMLQRRGTTTHYTRQQTMHWLKWLAGQMRQHSQTEFYFERIQLDWLPGGRSRWLSYRILARLGTGLLAGLVGGLVTGLAGGMVVGLIKELTTGLLKGLTSPLVGGPVPGLGNPLVFGLVTWLLTGLVGGFLVGLLHHIETQIKPAEVLRWSWRNMWQGVITSPFLKGGLVTWLLFGLTVGLSVWLLFGLIGLVIGLASGTLLGGLVGLLVGLVTGLVFGLVFGFFLWPIGGAISEFVGKSPNTLLEKHMVIRPKQGIRRSRQKGILVGLASGLVCGPIYGLLIGASTGFYVEWLSSSLFGRHGVGLIPGLVTGLVVALLSGMATGLFIGFTHYVETERKPVQVVVRLWVSIALGLVMNESLRRGVIIGLVASLLTWLEVLLLGSVRQVFEQSLGPRFEVPGPIYLLIYFLLSGLYNGLFLGGIFGLVRGIVSGLSSNLLDTRAIIRPNQGIRSSARNGMVVGLLSWLASLLFFVLFGELVFGLPFWLLYRLVGMSSPNLSGPFNGLAVLWLLVGPSLGLGVGLLVGLVSGSENGLLHGGTACIQQSVLRLLLWAAGYMPWNYIRFLDYAAERILLRKVGGGYIFVHPLFLEYFASLVSQPPASYPQEVPPPPPYTPSQNIPPPPPTSLGISTSPVSRLQWRAILLVVLVLLVIVGSAGIFAVGIFALRNNQIATNQAYATAAAQVNATATAQAFANATMNTCPGSLSQTQSCQTPHSLRVAYGVESLVERGLTGKGQTIIDIDSFGSPTLQQDVDVFDKAFGLPPITIQVISPLGTVPFDSSNQTMVVWASTITQDVQIMHALAPDAGIIVLTSPVAETEGTVGLPEFRQLIQYAINHHLGNIISNSWGASEATLKDQAGQQEIQKWNTMLQNATTQQGITFFAGTGTNGATDYTDLQGTKLSPTPTIGFPADEPWVTSVGGTTLLNNGQSAQENAWSSSGGGFSAFYPTPTYQQTLPASIRQNGRGVPDVSADADPSTGMAYYYSGSWQQAAASGPVWAALGAIANQMAGRPLGFINPGLYKVAASSAYAQAFHDITVGNNDVNSNGVNIKGYPAVPGWDPVTGWGSPDAEVLLPALVAALKQ